MVLWWFLNPRRLPDERLIDQTIAVMTQLRNRKHQEDERARDRLEGMLVAHLAEIELRTNQGRLFD